MPDKTELYTFILSFTSAFEDAPDGAWMAAHENAVETFNIEHDTDYDWYDEMEGYFEWCEK